jgi:hypothetical protein
VGFLWGRRLTSYLLAMHEHSVREDLHGSSHRSVIPYVHKRVSCIAQDCMSMGLFFFLIYLSDPSEEVSTQSIYNSSPDSYNETRDPTGGPKVVETLYNI